MSGIAYDPPIEDVPIFDASLFVVSTTTSAPSGSYLNFPVAQGKETLQAVDVNGLARFYNSAKVLGSSLLVTDSEGVPTSSIDMLPTPNNPSFGISSIDDGLTIKTNPSPSIELTKVGRTLNIATTAPNTILNIGTSTRTVSGRIHHYSDADNCVAGSGVHLNNGATNLSNTNIHNGANSIGQLNLASGTGSSTAIVMGATGTTTALRGTTTIDNTKTDTIIATSTGATASLYGNTTVGIIEYGVGQTTGPMNIATLTNRGGAINIGTGGTSTSIITVGNETVNNTTTYLKGNTFISSPTMDTISANSTSSICSLWNTVNAGTINIGNGQTSPFGSIAIGNSASRAGAIAIATGSGSTSQITIGTETTSNTTTTMYGNTVITKPQINVLAPTSSASTVYLYGGLSNGSVIFCANQTSGSFEIGSSASRTGAVEIAKNTKGNVNIASSMTAGTNTVTIGSTSLGTVVMRGAEVNLNTSGAGDVNICSSGGGNINIYQPLSPFYAPSVITSGDIGYTVRDTITFSGTIPTATNCYFFGTGKVLPIGVWLIQFTTRGRSSGTSTFTRYFTWGEDSVTGTTPLSAMTSLSSSTVIDSEGLSTTGTFVVSSTGSTTYNIAVYFVYSGSSIYLDTSAGFASVVKRTRIA